MQVVRSIAKMQRLARRLHAQGEACTFVPTMGALHEGHLTLIRHARRLARHRGCVVVSLFVNPTQFNSPEDLKKYPRTLAADLRQLRGEAVDYVFLPTARALYPKGHQTFVEPGPLAQPLCGRSRPGHFRGVATIVVKLCQLVQPDVALFGEKDFQQLQVIRQVVGDLNLPVKIIGCPTVRDKDGLALSSRNQRLSPQGRTKALCLIEAIRHGQRRVRAGARDCQKLRQEARRIIAPRAKIDYIEIVDPKTLQPLKRIIPGARLCLAAFVEDVRLIDNAPLHYSDQ